MPAYWDIGMAMDKQIMAYTYDRTWLGNEKKRTTDLHNTMNESQRHYAEWEKPDMKEYILYEFLYMKF